MVSGSSARFIGLGYVFLSVSTVFFVGSHLGVCEWLPCLTGLSSWASGGTSSALLTFDG